MPESGSSNLPSVIVRCCCNATTSKDSLTFDEHFFSRGKARTVGDHEIFCNSRIRDYDKELIAKPDGIQVSEFLRPIV